MLDFLGIGTSRAGIPWFVRWLRLHPEIRLPFENENVFWNKHYPQSLVDPNHKYNLNWYRGVFGHWSDADSRAEARKSARDVLLPAYNPSWFDRVLRCVDRALNGSIAAEGTIAKTQKWQALPHKLGEFSSGYGWLDRPETLPEIRAFSPDLRVIYIVRHPLQRAWSAVTSDLEAMGIAPHEVSEQWYRDYFQAEAIRRQGDYLGVLKNWRAHFPEEQILLLRYEEIATDPRALLTKLVSHIGVQQKDYYQTLSDADFMAKKPAAPQREIPKELFPVLQDLHGETIAALYKDMGIDYRSPPQVI